MDLLFVNPWIFDFAAYDFWLAPLGLLRAAGLVRERTGARIHWIDCLDRRHPSLPAPPPIKADVPGPITGSISSRPVSSARKKACFRPSTNPSPT